MKLDRIEYNKAEEYLRRYNYNCITILAARDDIISICSSNISGMPRAPYNVSDTVFNQVVRLQEDSELQKACRQWKTVIQALELLTPEHKKVFENIYVYQKSNWEIIEEMGYSQETFKRRKRDIIYKVYELIILNFKNTHQQFLKKN